MKEVSQCQLSVIVPTYCEAENLGVLIPRLSSVLEKAGISAEILIVDDDSPDNTTEVCELLAATHPVRLIVRKGERGLSSAVIHGMRQAQGDVLLVMDADLSHPPEKVPELFAAVSANEVDFAIGSRYVQGGATDDNWGLFRWLNSKVATLLARPLTSTRDPMSGFFALRRQTFLAAEKLSPVGYNDRPGIDREVRLSAHSGDSHSLCQPLARREQVVATRAIPLCEAPEETLPIQAWDPGSAGAIRLGWLNRRNRRLGGFFVAAADVAHGGGPRGGHWHRHDLELGSTGG